jgi:hypothetical protein
MNRDNTPSFSTKNSRIAHFKDFTRNLPKEEQDLDKVKRSFLSNEEEVYDLPNVAKTKYNRVSHKWEEDSKEEIQDKEKSIKIKKPSHKYKVVNNNSQTTNLEESNIFDEDDYAEYRNNMDQEEEYQMHEEEKKYTKEDLFDAFLAGLDDEENFDEWFSNKFAS